MARNEEFDRGEMINQIWAAKGKVSIAATRLKCDVSTIYAYAKRYTSVQEAIDKARDTWDEELLDVAEIKLYEHVKNGSAWALRYALSTKGKQRGYVERQELTGANGGAINQSIEFVWTDSDDNSGHGEN